MARKSDLCFRDYRFSLRLQIRACWRGISRCLVLCPAVVSVALAVPVLAESSESLQSSPDRAVPASTKIPLQKGKLLYEQGQFLEAVNVLDQAAQDYQADGDSLRQAIALSNLALTYQQLGLWDRASAAITASLTLLEGESAVPDTSDRRQVLAQVLNIQGRLQLAQGEAEQALATWQRAAAIAAQMGDPTSAIHSRLNEVQALQELGFYRRAFLLATEIDRNLQSQPDSKAKIVGMKALGDTLQRLGEFSRARQVLEAGLTIAQQLLFSEQTSVLLLSLGDVARAQGSLAEAAAFYQRAAATAPAPTLRVRAQLEALSVLVETQQWSEAQILQQQLEPQIADLPPSRAAVYAYVNFAQSLQKLRNADYQSRPKTGTPSQPAIARILARAVQQARELDDQRAEAYALGNLGSLYEQAQRWSDAYQLTRQALMQAQAINAPEMAYRWQWQLGRVLNAQDKREEAIAAYREAVTTLQSLRRDLAAANAEAKFSFRDSVEPVYREFVSLLLQSNRVQPDPQRLEQARKALEALQVAELDNFFREACLDVTPVQIDRLDRQAAILYPVILPDRVEVILSLPGQPLRQYATTVDSTEVEQTLDELLRWIRQPFNQEFLPRSQQIYDWLIRPAEDDLIESGVQTLVFIPDDLLRNIPLAALHDGERFLIQDYGIALAPGLELIQPQPLERGQLKALTAGLSEPRGGFSRIPFVKAELNQVQSQLPTQVLLNREFTKTAFESTFGESRFPVVHLATHGQFSSELEKTFILVWDDRLGVGELSDLLQMNTLRRSQPIELLVLSACDTAKGDRRAALGLAGIAVRSGARSTLATLWKVDDETTAILMGEFYRALTNPETTKAEALRRAQQFILQDPELSKYPYYWAPYVLIGNWL